MTPQQEQALETVAQEVRLMFHRLRAAVDGIHRGPSALSSSHRAVLESLERDGPQTVPALARARPVARQHIQVLVNDLLAGGLVSLRANPAHKRSPYVELSALGRERFARMRRREQAALARVPLPLGVRQLQRTAASLRALRAALESALPESLG